MNYTGALKDFFLFIALKGL